MDSTLRKTVISKRIMPFFLAVILLMTSIGALTKSVNASDRLDGLGDSFGVDLSRVGDFSDKAAMLGESEADLEVIEISSEAELRALADRVNSGDKMSGYLVKLTKNLTINGDNPWIPIGDSALNYFSGVFDGQGFTISGFSVSTDVSGGLFGFLVDATIRNLTVSSFVAPLSTSGLFFSAVGTTIDLSRSEQGGAISLLRRSPFATPSQWTGGTDLSWYAFPAQTFFEIDTADKLAGLAQLVNAGNTFAGKTILLAADMNLSTGGGIPWVSIGTESPAMPFAGTFVGNGRVISGIEGDALFGLVRGATITDFVVYDTHLNITKADGVGMVAHQSQASVFSKIHIKGSSLTGTTTSAGQTAGVGAIFGYSLHTGVLAGMGSIISQCLVEDTKIEGNLNVGGMMGVGVIASVSECVIYDSSVYNNSPSPNQYAGGIVSRATSAQSGGGIQDCLVLGVDFKSSGYVAGVGAIYAKHSIMKNIVVSDIKTTTAPPVGPPTSPQIYIGAFANNTGGMTNFFTDDSRNFAFAAKSNSVDEVMSSIYWDNIGDHGAFPVEGQNNNAGHHVSTLTNGKWVPSASTWVAQENFYPQLLLLERKSWNKSVAWISATASIPVISENVEENYKTGSSKIFLPTSIKVGGGVGNQQISWTGYEALETAGQIKVKPVSGGVEIISSGSAVTIPTLRADLGGYHKDFENINLVNTLVGIESYSPDGSVEIDADTVTEFEVVFSSPVTINPLAAGLLARLQIKRADGSYFTEDAIPLVPPTLPTDKFKVQLRADGKWVATFQMRLQAGSDYRMQIPAGMVTETGNAKALSEALDVSFTTKKVGSPNIDFIVKEYKASLSKDLQASDLVGNLLIKDFDGSTMFDGSVVPFAGVIPQEYAAPWDDNNIDKSMADAIAAMPANANTIYYHVGDTSVFTPAREAGTYQMYVMAKNVKGISSRRIMIFTIQGNPEWVIPPEPVVHIQWSKNKAAVTNAARGNAVANIPQKGGVNLPSPVRVSIPDAEWESVLLAEGGPSVINATVTAVNPSSGSNLSGVLSEKVVVYLDRPLYWTTTPSPVTMSLSTNRQVEEKINFLAMNFGNDVVKYEHWANNYRKPGLYYVDLESETQFTTACNDQNCKDSKHPADYVWDTFVVNIVQTPAPEITSFWGRATAELESTGPADVQKDSSYPYSKNIVKVNPTSYRLPSFVPEILKKQAYGKMEINYDDYRWNLYSNTLDTNKKWSDEYNLEAKQSVVNNGANNAIEIDFADSGRLFGTVEFELNLDKAREKASKLPNDNLGLYRYDGNSEKLILVSSVIVKDGKWASAMIKDIYPTAYVLKARNSEDVVEATTEEELTQFYLSTKVFDRDTKTISDGDPKLVTLPTDKDKLLSLITGVSATDTQLTESSVQKVPNDKGGTSSLAIIIAVVVTLIVAGGVAVLLLRKRKGKN